MNAWSPLAFPGPAVGGETRPQLGHNLTFGLLHAIGGAIAAGHYDGKPFPPEAELAEQYGTSLSVTREAVKMLTAKGLLASRPRQGTFILPVSHWSLLDTDVLRWLLQQRQSAEVLRQFNQLRIAIEPAAAEFAARFAWPRDVHRISGAFEAIRRSKRHQEDPLDAQIAFHCEILEASRNPFYKQFQAAVGTALRISSRVRGAGRATAPDIPAYAAVHGAIASGDWAAARESMRGIVAAAPGFLDESGRQTEGAAARSCHASAGAAWISL
ncbi:FCD domain-containing protein [Sphingomonas sp. HITSZ_GF]|uniref:FadR/GntR family transcriptional regulator n=1 Tax=Sphingomonas sp. HITSZ_GF TaxID=3037247 RepID=UPI00240D7FB8|nr:FCD domain-containing protein [Sphingomonas sp. HITSZ_GF]MDG2535163.1 FCD domain-containing protein [Sphingomonas sp. HITSZ_GF]